MSRVLVVSNDPLTERMPGPAIRAWHLAEVLSAEHAVTLASTVACTRKAKGFECILAEPKRRASIERSADVALITAGAFHEWPSLAASDLCLVVDLYDPYHLENLEAGPDEDTESRGERVRRMGEAINEHLRRGDYFLCATERQRDFWFGSLASIGRLNPYLYDKDPTLTSMFGVVPFGLPSTQPRRTGKGLRETVKGIGPRDKVILWAGGVYNWFDPVTLVGAMPSVVERIPEARLVFLGMKHPNPSIPAMKAAVDARAAADALGLAGSVVFFNEDWVPYDDRANFLLDADLGVSTHLDHIETRFSFRTRILDYLWTSLPMVLTEGDVLAEELASAGLAKTVPSGNVTALADALVAALEQERPDESSFQRVRERYQWAAVAAPLLKFCTAPVRAPDHRTVEQSRRDAPPEGADSYTPTVAPASNPSPRNTVSQLRERAIGGLIRTIAANTADDAVGRVDARIREVERILGDQGDAADEVAEIIGRTLTRLSAEVTALTSEVALLRERLEQLKSST
jgi:glycosyltransferase involved in cell wall biosynthesis